MSMLLHSGFTQETPTHNLGQETRGHTWWQQPPPLLMSPGRRARALAACYLLQLGGQSLYLLLIRLFPLVGLDTVRRYTALDTNITTARVSTPAPTHTTSASSTPPLSSLSALPQFFISTYLLLRDLEGLEVVADHPELLLQLHDLGLAGLGSLLRALEVGLHHGELPGDLGSSALDGALLS